MIRILPDNIPHELKSIESFIAWKYFKRKNGKLYKSPIAKSGYRIGYDSTDAFLSFEDAKEKIGQSSDIGLGISLLDGLVPKTDKGDVYLWCFDFDGFAQKGGEKVDDGVLGFVDNWPSYTEISPSGTGFKYFFVTTRKPTSKFKILFGPSAFVNEFPAERKYAHREIEVFSSKCFLALTGDLFNSKTKSLRFLSDDELDQILEHFCEWATSTGGAGRNKKADGKEKQTVNEFADNNSIDYAKLSPESLVKVLSHIDNTDEQLWSDVANALARVYGDEGRQHYQKWSTGEYTKIPFQKYNPQECNKRYNRALGEYKTRPYGYGVNHLVELASIHPQWEEPALSYEEMSPFSDETVSNGKRFSLLTTQQLYNRPPLKWRVKGLLPERGLASVFGASKSGKTFLVTDLSANVALGERFFGLKTNACTVVYVSLEGAGGIPNRIKAWERHHKKNLPDTFRVCLDKFLLAEKDVRAFAQEINEAQLSQGMIVIDTLSQASGGADENSSADMGRLIASANLLQQLTDNLVVLVHHTGKDARRGARGHSSLGAALDASIEVKYPASGRVWVRDKVKDGVDGIATDFRLEKINLGFDADGGAITSCVAVGDLLRVNAPKPPQGRNQVAVLAAIKSKHNIGDEVALMQLVKDAESALNGKPAPRAKEAIKRLIDKGHLIENGNTCQIA